MDLKKGDKVHYQPEHFGDKMWENGIVKRAVKDGAFVVYNCDGNWDRIDDYTAAKTSYDDLKLGWRYK